MPVNKENMNYTVVILGAVFIGAGGWYAIDAKKWFKGPLGNVDVDESADTQSGSSGDKIDSVSEENIETQEKQ